MEPRKDTNSNSGKNQYLRYTGMAFQLLVLLLFGAWLGGKADRYFNSSEPYFTAGILLFFLIAYLVKIYYDLK